MLPLEILNVILNACAISKRVANLILDLSDTGRKVMSNATDSDDDFTLDRPVVLGPVIAMASLLVILLGIAVLLFARNRRARVTRLRERVELAESRVNALLKIQQVYLKY